MATSTIGTASRDYSTIASWEAALGTGSQTGECYDDSAFDESVTINDADPSDTTLTVAAGERHDGTAGTGARIVATTARNLTFSVVGNLHWLELNGGGFGSFVTANGGVNQTLSKLLVHDSVEVAQAVLLGFSATNNYTQNLLNSIVYDVSRVGSTTVVGVSLSSFNSTRVKRCYNVVIDRVDHNAGAGAGICVSADNSAGNSIKNTVATRANGTGTGTDLCFSLGGANTVRSHIASSDTTADGTGSLTSIVTADQYVSTVNGSEDLHIQDTDADIFEAGTDLGTSPTGVNIDINGYDRDAGGTTWSMGADDGNNLRGGASPAFPFQRYYLGGMSL